MSNIQTLIDGATHEISAHLDPCGFIYENSANRSRGSQDFQLTGKMRSIGKTKPF